MKIQKIVTCFFILTGILYFSIPVNHVYGSDDQVKQVIFKIEGANCPGCPAEVKLALQKLPGIVKVQTNLNKPMASIDYQEGKVTVEQMVKAIKSIGLGAVPLNETILRFETTKCPTCPVKAQKLLKKLPGIFNVTGKYSKPIVRVIYPEGKVTAEQIVMTIKNAGMKAEVIK